MCLETKRTLVYEPAHVILVHISYTQKPNLIAHAHVSSARGPRKLTFGLRLHLHPYFLYVSRKGSGETAQRRMLV